MYNKINQLMTQVRLLSIALAVGFNQLWTKAKAVFATKDEVSQAVSTAKTQVFGQVTLVDERVTELKTNVETSIFNLSGTVNSINSSVNSRIDAITVAVKAGLKYIALSAREGVAILDFVSAFNQAIIASAQALETGFYMMQYVNTQGVPTTITLPNLVLIDGQSSLTLSNGDLFSFHYNDSTGEITGVSFYNDSNNEAIDNVQAQLDAMNLLGVPDCKAEFDAVLDPELAEFIVFTTV